METRLPSKFVHTAFAATILSLLSGAAVAQAPLFWSLTGNANTDPAKFLGTTPDPSGVVQPLIIQPGSGNVGIGTKKPAEKLSVNGNIMFGNTELPQAGRMGVDQLGVWIEPVDPTSGIRLNASQHAIGLYLAGSGNVGIGITNPRAKLDIFSGFDTNALVFGRSAGDYHSISTSFHGEKPRNNYLGFNVEYNSNDIRRVLTLVGDGTVGIGTMSPASMLEVHGTSDKAGISGIGPNVAIYAHNTASGHDAYLGSGCCAGDFNGDIYVHGHTTTQVLEITGGSDLAEPFTMDREATIEPGMVLAIDPVHPGQLRLADRAYDRTVAGIVSGANGIKPGLTMTSGATAHHSRPVALTGRVYVFADATRDPIQPGDLLTTADTPGHAMKVTDYARAQGAVLGKAMSALPAGKGLILVLVTLQ